MAVAPNPQRVPLGTDAEGRPVLITREWLRFFEASAPTGTADLSSLQASVALLQAQVAALNVRVTALEAQRQEIGYHL